MSRTSNVVPLRREAATTPERWLDKRELSAALYEMGYRVGPRRLLDLAAKHGMPSEFQFQTRMFLLSEVLAWLDDAGYITRRRAT